MRVLRTAWHLLLVASLLLAPHGLLHAQVEDHEHQHPGAHVAHVDEPGADHADLRDVASHHDAQAGPTDDGSLLVASFAGLVVLVLARLDAHHAPPARDDPLPLPPPPQWRPPLRGPPAIPVNA